MFLCPDTLTNHQDIDMYRVMGKDTIQNLVNNCLEISTYHEEMPAGKEF